MLDIHSGEKVTSAPMLESVDDGQSTGRLISPLRSRKSEVSAVLARISQSTGERSMSRASRTFFHNKTYCSTFKREEEPLHAEREALRQVSEAELQTRILLEEQRSQLLSEATFELILQEMRAEIVKNTKIYDKNKPWSVQNYKAERAHQDPRTLPILAQGHRVLSTKRVRVIVICDMFTTLLTPTRRTSSQPQQPTPLPSSTSTQAQSPHVTSHITPEAHSS